MIYLAWVVNKGRESKSYFTLVVDLFLRGNNDTPTSAFIEYDVSLE